MGIRGICFCVWWLIREQQHRMMRKWENEYLRIGWNRCNRSNRRWFHWMIIERYLHQSNTKSILSRITDPIYLKLKLPPQNSVNEGRSIYSSTHSIPLRIVNVFLYLYGIVLIVFRSASPSRAKSPSWMDCSLGKSESSIHPFNHSQTQPNEHHWMHHSQV